MFQRLKEIKWRKGDEPLTTRQKVAEKSSWIISTGMLHTARFGMFYQCFISCLCLWTSLPDFNKIMLMCVHTTAQFHWLTSTVFCYTCTNLTVCLSSYGLGVARNRIEHHASAGSCCSAAAAVQSQYHATLVTDHCDAVATTGSSDSRRPVQSEVICDADGEIT